MMVMTSIAIHKETRNQLATIGTKDSTFDDIIQELLKKWNNENILKMMEDHNEAVVPGTAVYQKWMEFVMELRGLISSTKSKAALNIGDDNKPMPNEVSYTEIPVSQQGPPSQT